MLLLFFIQTINSALLSVDSKLELLYEKKFDKEIEQVAFDSYLESGCKKFYPKIIVFNDRKEFVVARKYYDARMKDRRVFERNKKEVRIFSSTKEKIESIKGFEDNFYSGGEVWISKRGNFFVVLQTVYLNSFYDKLTYLYLSAERARKLKPRERAELVRNMYEAEYGELMKSSIIVYNDKGEMLWQKESWETPYDASYHLLVSPRDGSILYGVGMDGMNFVIYDPSGQRLKSLTKELNGYILKDFAFADDWRYIAVGYQKYPLYRYEELPGKSFEPGLFLLDSSWNSIWEKESDNYLMDWVIISPNGKYTGVGTHTMKGFGRGLARASGELYDKGSNFVMEMPWKEYRGVKVHSFSENEKYLASSNKDSLILIDLSNKSIVFKRKLSAPILDVLVSNEGKTTLITRKRENAEYYSIGRPRSWRFYTNVYVVNETGKIIWSNKILEGEPKMRQGPSMLLVNLLDWDYNEPIIGIVDKESGIIKIEKILIENKM